MAAWIFVAMTAPLAQMAGGSGWVQVIAVGLIGLLFCWFALKMRQPQPRLICALQWVWVILTAAVLLRETANSWPMGDAYPVVPLAILALALWAAQKGTQAASSASGTLLYIVVIGFVLILAAGLGQVEWTKELEQPRKMNPGLILVFLLPCAAEAIPGAKKQANRGLLGCFLFAALCALVVQGILSADVMEQTETPFYEMSRGLELLGMWERFEALVCALLTAGWFAMLELLLCAGGFLFLSVWKKDYQIGVWVTAGIAFLAMLCNMRINATILGFSGLICWGILPGITQGIVAEKKL